MKSAPLRFGDVSVDDELPGCWWYCANENGTTIAIENPRMEADGDESGVWYAPEYDSFKIRDNTTHPPTWRKLTDEEDDEFGDDVREWLRHCDWEV